MRQAKSRTSRIRIYSKADCHLCDEAKEVVYRVAREFDVPVEELDIDYDKQAFELYRYEIPVVFVDDVKLFKFRVDEAKLKRALQARY